MLKIYIGIAGQQEVDYTPHIDGSTISITKQLNVPTLCSFSMYNTTSAFKLPALRSYVRIYSTKYQRSVFTGFITNDPSRSFLGMGRPTSFGGQLFKFDLNMTSDEYLLNIKSVKLIPAFVNQSQGAIMQSLAETLCPGFYDFTYCASGNLVPFLQYDPSQSWSEMVKGFADASRFRYSAIDKKIIYQPYGDDILGVAYDEEAGQGTFDPVQLSTGATTTAVVNDITIIGAQEAGDNHEDFFVGDGFTGAFPLRHKVFGASSQEQGSSILLSDSWNGTSLNSQNWIANDPSQNFFYGAVNSQALNILTGITNPAGSSSIIANNALELAGGLVLQHGEVVFNDSSEGLIGGVYDNTILNGFGNVVLDRAKCEAAFQITPTATVEVTASGAAGINIQPFRLGANPQKSFWGLTTKVNCSYVLTTSIALPAASRYNQVYRSMAGIAFGGGPDQTLVGNITWTAIETNLFTGVQTTYTFTEKGVTLPQVAVYALVDNDRLNITLNTTYITAPIPGSLNATCKIGAGLLAPIYVSGNVQYTGAFVTPSGGNLPILPGAFGPENNFALGTSLQNQAAEIDSGQVTDALNFYSDDTPGVGVRIRLQTWESQAAISRVQDATSIATEATIVGDDGLRAATVSNLVPLPRTSEDCDFAAQAFLEDRTGIFYQGTYNASFKFFKQTINNIEFYPTCGRYLYINSPRRNIVKQNFIVTSMTTTVVEMAEEAMNHAITFGPDLFLDKLLAAVVPLPPSNVLAPIDTTVQPTPQQLAAIGTNYLPDVQQTSISKAISGDQYFLDLNDAVPKGAHYEIRQADLNWGNKDGNLLATSAVTGSILLPRLAYDQTWFIRFVELLPATNTLLTSRRTKVIRIFYPRVPTIPAYIRSDSTEIFVDFSGDTRNIEGIELRGPRRFAQQTTYYRAIVGSEFDMDLNLNTLRGQLSPGQASTGPIGQFQVAEVPPTLRQFNIYFFNLMWEYSPGLTITIPAPSAPKLREGYRFGSILQLIQTFTDPVPRTDIQSTILEISNDPSFNIANILLQLQVVGAPGTLNTTVPATGDLYARSVLVDSISSGAWSPTLFIPQANLIASDYLSSQGSVPPAITQALAASGGIFTYVATSDVIQIACAGFIIQYPSGQQDAVAPVSQAFSAAKDAPGGLFQATMYGFFPSIVGPTTRTPAIDFNGPWLHYADTSTVAAIIAQFSDGNVPLTNGVFVAQTATGGGTSGGGGGGTNGGGNCGEISRQILLSDGRRIALKDLCLGERVQTMAGRVSKVVKKQITLEDTITYKTKSGLETETAFGHVLFSAGKWQTFSSILGAQEFEDIKILTANDNEDSLVELISGAEPRYICKIELEPLDTMHATDDDHVYNLDGFWTHNAMVKN